jgi:hypothetical protein
MNSCNQKHTIYTGETVGLVLAMYEDDGITPVTLEDKVMRVVVAQGSDVVAIYQNPMPLISDLQYGQMEVKENKLLINFTPDQTKGLEGVYDIQVMQVTVSEAENVETSIIGVFTNILEVKYAIIGKI